MGNDRHNLEMYAKIKLLKKTKSAVNYSSKNGVQKKLAATSPSNRSTRRFSGAVLRNATYKFTSRALAWGVSSKLFSLVYIALRMREVNQLVDEMLIPLNSPKKK